MWGRRKLHLMNILFSFMSCQEVNLWRHNYLSKNNSQERFLVVSMFFSVSFSLSPHHYLPRESPHLGISTHLTKIWDMLFKKLKRIYLNIYWASSHCIKKWLSWQMTESYDGWEDTQPAVRHLAMPLIFILSHRPTWLSKGDVVRFQSCSLKSRVSIKEKVQILYFIFYVTANTSRGKKI